MECNRDEAARAKLIAEDKIEKRDFTGAKKFALKAKTLYPELDGIAQILTTVDVYISAETKINGEIDWYGVLSVNPSADDETIRKQYRKLALMLHPDKNRSRGADGAFKLISEAWRLLSDKAKRLAYNQRRGYRVIQQQKVQTTPGDPSAQANNRPNGIFNFAKKTTTQVPNIKTQNNNNNNLRKPKPAPPPPSNKPIDTFWTICFRCRMHYEYLKMYLNNTLLCPNCNEAFTATETAPPANFSKSTNQAFNRNVPIAQKPGPGSNPVKYSQSHQDLHSGKANVAVTDPFVAAKAAATVVQQAQDKIKKAYNESNASEGCVKRTKLDGNSSFGTGHASESRIYGFSNVDLRPNTTRDLTMAETRTMLTAKAKYEILNVIRSSEKTAKAATGKEKDAKKEIKKQKRQKDCTDDKINGNDNRSAADSPITEGPASETMTVPDPDFHDFDLDRSETSFGDNEVWAAYDNDDGMPRFYALISRVISRTPFKLRISWLNSKTTAEFGKTNWVGSGFYKTCGEFRVSRYEICNTINSFSQKVNWSKGPRGTFLILPRKGDTWAIYKKWSADWNEHTPDEVIHEYEMVTVLDDYNNEEGASVAPLAKVAGFRTIFRPNSDPEAIKRIPKEEMFRFSHRVPHHLITGSEGENAPKGCLELDPAATPLELLQVVPEGGVPV